LTEVKCASSSGNFAPRDFFITIFGTVFSAALGFLIKIKPGFLIKINFGRGKPDDIARARA
jgi:hypothetical protein